MDSLRTPIGISRRSLLAGIGLGTAGALLAAACGGAAAPAMEEGAKAEEAPKAEEEMKVAEEAPPVQFPLVDSSHRPGRTGTLGLGRVHESHRYSGGRRGQGSHRAPAPALPHHHRGRHTGRRGLQLHHLGPRPLGPGMLMDCPYLNQYPHIRPACAVPQG